jgi:predicted phosphodiesterase
MKFLKYDLTNVAVIGDIHSSLANLNDILAKVDVENRRKIITVGDVWDRGNEPNETIDILYDLYTRGKLIPLVGNHDNKFMRYFTDASRVNMGSQQQGTLEKITDESKAKFMEIFAEEIVCIYDPVMKIFISHGPGGRPNSILHKNYENLRILIGGQANVTFEEFLLKESHIVAKKHISTLLYGITMGDKTEEGFPVRLPLTKSETDDLDGWIYMYGHIHATTFYPEVNKNCVCLDHCSPTGKIGGSIITSRDNIQLVV